MENDRDIRALTPKFRSFDGVVSPIHAINFSRSRRYRSMFDPYASDSSDSPSPLMKYLCSADTAAASPAAFITPVKIEEDVIVMDGIPVPKSNKGSGEARMRSPLMPSNSAIGGFGRTNSTSSPSSGSGGRGTEHSKLYMNRLCRFWETSGVCQFGSECQFAHGKEELRPHRSLIKIQPEIFKQNNCLEGSNSSSYGSKSSQISRVKAKSAAAEMDRPTSPVRIKQPSVSPNSNGPIPNTCLSRCDWTPEDDGIEVTLPLGHTEEKNSSKDVDAYIEKVLYSTSARKRLPVFVEICPDC